MKSETRNLIIKTASDLFYKKGYNLTGINEIIAEAGIAKATLYSHFRSKEDLCIAYLELRDQELMIDIKSFCESKPKGDKQLLAVLKYLIPFFESDNFQGCWCIRTVAEIPRENEKIRKQIRSNKQLLLNYIIELVKSNKPDLHSKSREKLARQIYLLYEGAVAESHLQGESWPILQNIDILKSLLQKV